MNRQTKFKKTEIGMNPEEWEVRGLRKDIKNIGGIEFSL
jgi:hypothetical protein